MPYFRSLSNNKHLVTNNNNNNNHHHHHHQHQQQQQQQHQQQHFLPTSPQPHQLSPVMAPSPDSVSGVKYIVDLDKLGHHQAVDQSGEQHYSQKRQLLLLQQTKVMAHNPNSSIIDVHPHEPVHHHLALHYPVY